MARLPVVQSVPHAGLAVPPEIASRLAIDPVTIYNEADLWADRLYDFGQGVLERVTMPIARVLIDANRPPHRLDDPDGPVKTRTSYGEPVYRDPPPEDLRLLLLRTYWQAFHARLEAALQAHRDQVRLLLDCHNMAQRGPSAYSDPGRPRPYICLANFGDAQGNPLPGGPRVTAPPELLRRAGEVAQELFGDLSLLEPDPEGSPPVVELNTPFRGGYILQHYTDPAFLDRLGRGDSPYVGIMVEINRGLFVGNQHARTPQAPPNQERITAIRRRLLQWVQAVVEML